MNDYTEVAKEFLILQFVEYSIIFIVKCNSQQYWSYNENG